MKTYSQIRYGDYAASEISVTLRMSGADYGGGSEVLVLSYQKVTGTLNPGAHPGSYNGQDAYNDMLVTNGGICNGIGTSKRRNNAGGVSMLERKP